MQHSGEMNQAEVLQRPAINNKEDTIFQAEIVVPQGGANHSGHTRVFTIRGPPRKTQDQAARDAKQLTEESPKGPKAVRTLANALHRS